MLSKKKKRAPAVWDDVIFGGIFVASGLMAFLGLGLFMSGFAVFLAGRGLETRVTRTKNGACQVSTLRKLFGWQEALNP